MILEDEIRHLNENGGPLDVLKWGIERFHPNIALAFSGQAEDVVILDMLNKIVKVPKVFVIDTGRLHQETYDLLEEVRNKYVLDLRIYFPDHNEIEEMVNNYGINLFYKGVEYRKLCCNLRKVSPLKRALSGLSAWITGLRKEQNFTREKVNRVEIDEINGGIIKLNPLADWTWDQVWGYVKENNLPYNKLYDRGYKSIGCQPCTRPVKPWEHPRAGRWWWEKSGDRECGLHFREKR
ncbi:phosphoadenosine phosphosulfate reductase [Sulfolobus sp. A20]|uniref:phosphoadenylyl-sulfate reductase n=1 Tax=Saccharolobus sp. A20 TaxID=1891280 RepID=UPI000845D419|nr:phosphoadenylyl-sulfate reductase [Sulfolobus sp. A20]AOL16651.1 phosphoadenosine phosphosulfate reductase [Sulfolobus sp. A20]TRM74409.1 phosphoadenylyl-sulfate reductase [Sulfolobus sp. B5]